MLFRKVFQPAPPKAPRFRDDDGNEVDEITKIFGTVNCKADVLCVLTTCQSVFHRIVIDKAPIVSKDQAEKDFRRERVILNGVVFIPDKFDDSRSEAFARTLRILVERMQRSTSVGGGVSSSSSSGGGRSRTPSNASVISDVILQRGCRTSAGADSFFLVQKLFCLEGTFVTQKTSLHAEEPIVIDVFMIPDELETDLSMSTGQGDTRLNSKLNVDRPISASTVASTADQSQPSDASISSGGTGSSSKKAHKENGGFISRIFSEALKSGKTTSSSSSSCSGPRHGSVDISTVCGAGGSGATAAGRVKTSLITRVEVKNSFAVYDESAMDDTAVVFRSSSGVSNGSSNGGGSGGGSASGMGGDNGGPIPWLEVDTVLVDETNFETMQHWRRIQLIVTAVNGSPFLPPPTAAGAGAYGKEGKDTPKYSPSVGTSGCIPTTRESGKIVTG